VAARSSRAKAESSGPYAQRHRAFALACSRLPLRPRACLLRLTRRDDQSYRRRTSRNRPSGGTGLSKIPATGEQVDIIAIDGKLLASPAPGQPAGPPASQLRGDTRRISTIGLVPYQARPGDAIALRLGGGGWTQEGPGHPVDNGGRACCRQDGLRSEGMPGPSSERPVWPTARIAYHFSTTR